jgi:hypothetical protein
MADEEEEVTSRQEFEFSMKDTFRGKVSMRLLDRINVDDVFLHLIQQEIFSVRRRFTPNDDIPTLVKDFLLKERFKAGQN